MSLKCFEIDWMVLRDSSSHSSVQIFRVGVGKPNWTRSIISSIRVFSSSVGYYSQKKLNILVQNKTQYSSWVFSSKFQI